ncbi:MAG: hypothetical protein K2M12_09880 [Muribaculaceae bacterium]|nr:hypothetical protein [Muribaculaceae bacterium]
MSKLQLKKELASLTREQLIQVVLDAYSARKETKEYFEFFLNPDVDALHEKYMRVVGKELLRNKHYHSKARATVVRRAIRDFASFDPGPEFVLAFMLDVLKAAIARSSFVYYTEAFNNGVARLIDDIIAFADKNAMIDRALSSLRALAADEKLGHANYRNFYLARFL